MVCYDESLSNKVIQESEIDLVIRFWDNNSNKVQVRYWDSLFLKHINDDGLTGSSSMVDGGAQHKLGSFKRGQKGKGGAGLSKLINIGSLNLHVVHGALQSVTDSTIWNLKLMKGAYQIYKDFLAGRED